MLTAYQTQTSRLLQNPAAPSTLYATSDLTSWINSARGQLAGEGECIRVLGTVSTVIGQSGYSFSSINLGSATGVAGVIHVRRVSYGLASGQQWITPRPWEWFDYYTLLNPVPVNGPPTSWSQFGQGAQAPSGGSSASGSFYINPPDLVYTLYCDCVCYPSALVDDTTAEAIPYLWTDAVPYFAAYLALLSAQTNARMADAERYFGYYQTFVERARKFSNPSVLRWQSQQASDVAQAMKFGLKPGGGQGGGQ